MELINLAIDNEQEDETVEDWTMKSNVNLHQSVKLRPKLSADKIHLVLNMDVLFAGTTPTSSEMILQWQDTQSRSRKLNHSIVKKDNFCGERCGAERQII